MVQIITTRLVGERGRVAPRRDHRCVATAAAATVGCRNGTRRRGRLGGGDAALTATTDRRRAVLASRQVGQAGGTCVVVERAVGGIQTRRRRRSRGVGRGVDAFHVSSRGLNRGAGNAATLRRRGTRDGSTAGDRVARQVGRAVGPGSHVRRALPLHHRGVAHRHRREIGGRDDDRRRRRAGGRRLQGGGCYRILSVAYRRVSPQRELARFSLESQLRVWLSRTAQHPSARTPYQEQKTKETKSTTV